MLLSRLGKKKKKEKKIERKQLGGAHAPRDEAGSGSHPACFSAPGEEKGELAQADGEEQLENKNSFQKEIPERRRLQNAGRKPGGGTGACWGGGGGKQRGVLRRYWSCPSMPAVRTGG